MSLQQFGVMPFKIKTSKKRHKEKWRTQRHRWCTKHQRIFAGFIIPLVYFIPKQWLARFITKAISNTYTTPLSLFVPSAPPCFPLSVCLLYVVGLLYHSIFRKNQKNYLIEKHVIQLNAELTLYRFNEKGKVISKIVKIVNCLFYPPTQ